MIGAGTNLAIIRSVHNIAKGSCILRLPLQNSKPYPKGDKSTKTAHAMPGRHEIEHSEESCDFSLNIILFRWNFRFLFFALGEIYNENGK